VDTLASIDVATVVGPIAGTSSQLDTEVMNPDLTWKQGYTTHDVIAAGGPVVCMVNCKYDGPMAGAWFDASTWEIVTATSHRYSDPEGRHTFIALVKDGNRLVLIASGFTAYGTRAAGIMLKNYAQHAYLLKGTAVVFIPIDSDGDGFWEEGEEIQILEQVQPTTTPTPSFASPEAMPMQVNISFPRLASLLSAYPPNELRGMKQRPATPT